MQTQLKNIPVYLFSSLLFLSVAEARPEYAVRNAAVSCTACHVSPVGGSIKNLSGKLYAASSRNFAFTPKKYQENLSFDLRVLFYESEKFSGSRGGLALMNAAVGGILPIEEGDGYQTQIVANYDLGALANSPRDVYVITDLGENKFLENILIGKFIVPFGLLTDEHRTYVRMQTLTSFNDFEMGALFSGRLGFDSLHYDVAALSGMNSAGALVAENAHGGVFNVRWAPAFLPFYLGASINYFKLHAQSDPTANSVYLALSLDRLTNSLIKGSFLIESARAQYFNSVSSGSQVPAYFIGSDSAYQAEVDKSESGGLYAQLLLDITPKTSLIYKFDNLSLDSSYDGDRFDRHGIGFRQIITRQTSVAARYEMAETGRAGVSDALRSAQNVFWAVFQAWF